MKIAKILVFGFIICLSLAGCAITNMDNSTSTSSANIAEPVSTKGEAASDEQDYSKLFELNLYTDKQAYQASDKIEIWATLKYIGSDDQIKIWHSNPYISFTITDGKKFETGGVFDDILTSTVLEKDKLYQYDYVKSGGYSADDPDAVFWRKFYQEKDLYLPAGEYTVRAGVAFSLSQDMKKGMSNLLKEIKIKVED